MSPPLLYRCPRQKIVTALALLRSAFGEPEIKSYDEVHPTPPDPDEEAVDFSSSLMTAPRRFAGEILCGFSDLIMSRSAPPDVRGLGLMDGLPLRGPPAYYTTQESHLARERQNRTAYRYGLCLVCLGVLLNWLGFYERVLAPIRYLGLGCVVGGGLLICGVMCRTLGTSRRVREEAEAQAANGDPPSIHVLNLEYSIPRVSAKPPDYFATVRSDPMELPPPSYDEALRCMSPSTDPGGGPGPIPSASSSNLLATCQIEQPIISATAELPPTGRRRASDPASSPPLPCASCGNELLAPPSNASASLPRLTPPPPPPSPSPR
ncbi:unnamed protein product [Cyprideis torosa]|uniref:Uncharacterized protein n=1 Tax=Cyprideis torosa TaxID=163714 RepID=A0A7R8ZRH0_9CRUS|nr:unnamed protein product [Cyprideis torosa]CAG0893036.1 unnamed protein product [Cyprideis torosa]